MKKLLLSPAATVTLNPQGVLLQSDLGDFQLHGKDIADFIEIIMPLLNGDSDEQEMYKKLPNYSKSSICATISLLKQHGLIEEVDSASKFGPPWAMHERFAQAWPTGIQNMPSLLQQASILVAGLEPWSLKMVDELANAGVGHIHILDSEKITVDDVLCHRSLGEENIGELRANVLQTQLEKQAPWCKVTVQALEKRTDHGVVFPHSTSWDLVVVTLGKEAKFWTYQISVMIHKYAYPAIYGCLDGLESWIGPIVNTSSDVTDSCWNCLRLRKLGTENRPEIAHELEKITKEQEVSRARSMLSPMAALTGHKLSMEVLKLLSGYTQSELVGRVNVENLITQTTVQHTVLPVPWCEVCGYDHSAAPTHVHALQPHSSQGKNSVFGAMSAVATHQERAVNPLNNIGSIEELKQLFSGWIDEKTGIIRQLTGHAPHLPDFPITASASVSNFTAGKFDPRASGLVGSGKGLDSISAHISAIGEAIERYSAARYRLQDCHYASISQLSGEHLDPNDLVLYSKRQYHTPSFPFSKWDRKQKIHWSQGSWLGTDKPVWVPSLVSYFNFSCPYKEQFSQVSSNGLAAGQNNEDAAMRATFELIERDAMMLTWYGKQPCQRLKFDSVYQGKMRVMIDDLTSSGVKLELYLLDVGIHIPTVVCLAFGDGLRTPAVSVALACHGDIKIAIHKALLEQGHVMPYLCYLMSSGHNVPQQVQQVQSLEDHAAYYFRSDKTPAFDFMRQPLDKAIDIDQWPYSKLEGIDDLRQRLVEAKVDVAIVDVTSPDVALSPFRVARAVGVHMQPIHFGEQFKRVDNPRLSSLLKGKAVNMDPHPIA